MKVSTLTSYKEGSDHIRHESVPIYSIRIHLPTEEENRLALVTSQNIFDLNLDILTLYNSKEEKVVRISLCSIYIWFEYTYHLQERKGGWHQVPINTYLIRIHLLSITK